MPTLSFSGLQLYDRCPSAFNRRYLLKEKTPPREGKSSPAAMRGTRIHKEIEELLIGNTDTLGEEAKFYEPFFLKVRETSNVVPEARFNFDPDWGYRTFGDKGGMIRGVMDAIVFAMDTTHVYEFKTGKKYGEHAEQRALYGLAGLLMDGAKQCHVTTIYIDQQKNEATTFGRELLPLYKFKWEDKVNTALDPDQEYPERPSWKCDWCDFNKSNGGTCIGQG